MCIYVCSSIKLSSGHNNICSTPVPPFRPRLRSAFHSFPAGARSMMLTDGNCRTPRKSAHNQHLSLHRRAALPGSSGTGTSPPPPVPPRTRSPGEGCPPSAMECHAEAIRHRHDNNEGGADLTAMSSAAGRGRGRGSNTARVVVMNDPGPSARLV